MIKINNMSITHELLAYSFTTILQSNFVPVVVGFKGTILIQAQIFCLLVSQLCQVGLKSGQMQTGDIFI